MINFIKDAVTAVSGIKTFLFNTDYRNNFDLQNVEFPCCVLTPIMRTNYDLNNIIRESAELQLSVVDLAPYEYTGDDLYEINKRCSDLALQVIANLQVKSKLDKELTFEFILPSGDELISGVMCNLQCTMKQGSCIGAPSYVEIVVQPIKKESITSNGKHVISPSSGFTAMREVEVDVIVPVPTTEIKNVTITSNGEVEILPTSADAMTKVIANVQVPPPKTKPKLDVNFYDCDGTILYSYTASEFLELTEMPPLPTREGLICQEWNWDYEDAIDYVRDYGMLLVGATYITNDGATRIYVEIPTPLSMSLGFNSVEGCIIDWGDGYVENVDVGDIAIEHRFSVGNYCISIKGDIKYSSTTGFIIKSSNHAVYKIELGNNIPSGYIAKMFINYFRLEIITIPNHLVGNVGEAVFYGLRNIKSLIIPKRVGSIILNAFDGLITKALILPSSISVLGASILRVEEVIIPPKVAKIEMVFNGNLELIKMPIPCSTLENNAFRETNVFIFIFGANIKQIGADCFYSARSVKMYDFRKTMQVPTLLNSVAFQSIANDCKIVVPDNLYDNWVIATNWSTYSSYIIKASEYVE